MAGGRLPRPPPHSPKRRHSRHPTESAPDTVIEMAGGHPTPSRHPLRFRLPAEPALDTVNEMAQGHLPPPRHPAEPAPDTAIKMDGGHPPPPRHPPRSRHPTKLAPDTAIKNGDNHKAEDATALNKLDSHESWTTHRVPHRLREVNNIAYEPNVISIGPYHCGKEHLRAMEDVKRFCFHKILEHKNLQFDQFDSAIRNLQEPDLRYYEGIGPVNKYIKMMVYDGCFIVQLIRNSYPEEICELGRHIQTDMWHDLLLLENQLPFSVLLKLDRIIMRDNTDGNLMDFSRAALSFFQNKDFGPKIWSGRRTCPSPILHLLDLVHKCCRPSPQGIEHHRKKLEGIKGEQHQKKLEEIKGEQHQKKLEEIKGLGWGRSWKFIRSATELNDTGIRFSGKSVLQDDESGLFDIKFTKRPYSLKFCKIKIPMVLANKKVLEIPTLLVDDNTERMLRNLLAYEQFARIGEPTYVYDYVVLMDNLINTDKDVQLLCTSGVIDNWLGDDEAVAQMFNKLRDKLYSSENFYYAEIFDKVNKHSNGDWNKLKAKLRKDYFSSPWSICAFFAAFIVLVATVLQSVYALISYYHPK